jgi:hypothetical protein
MGGSAFQGETTQARAMGPERGARETTRGQTSTESRPARGKVTRPPAGDDLGRALQGKGEAMKYL